LDPVIALFFSGFALAVAARRWKLDEWIVNHALRLSRGEPYRLIVLAAVTTVGLSMWMSNIAAAALVFGALQPVLTAVSTTDRLRRALLLAVTLAADVGGVATPIGSGPNGIAMAAVAHVHRIGFVEWMAFGVPLALGLLVAVIIMTLVRFRPTDQIPLPASRSAPLKPGAWVLCAIVACTIGLWLTERLHGWPAWTVALGAVASLSVLGLLKPGDIRRIDWGTLLLVAGGIALGALLDRSGAMYTIASRVPFDVIPHTVGLFALCILSACLSALMSNTATATLLIPFAATIDPSPSTAILIAVTASLGVPFVISTPPNAMAVANGLHSRDLLVPGLLLMCGGCLAVALTGPYVLHAMGIP
jgi:sodium-dependent dicarboxylate transporter 2/3/5